MEAALTSCNYKPFIMSNIENYTPGMGIAISTISHWGRKVLPYEMANAVGGIFADFFGPCVRTTRRRRRDTFGSP